MPVVILTARSSIEETVTGFDGGADDYVTRPFRFEELLARIRVRLRDRNADQGGPTVLRAGDVALDLRTRHAIVGRRTVDLSAREFALARRFCGTPVRSSAASNC